MVSYTYIHTNTSTQKHVYVHTHTYKHVQTRMFTRTEASWFLRKIAVTLVGDAARAAVGSNTGIHTHKAEKSFKNAPSHVYGVTMQNVLVSISMYMCVADMSA